MTIIENVRTLAKKIIFRFSMALIVLSLCLSIPSVSISFADQNMSVQADRNYRGDGRTDKSAGPPINFTHHYPVQNIVVVHQTYDGGYAFIAANIPSSDFQSVRLIKTNQWGTIEWLKDFRSLGRYELPVSFAQTADWGFIALIIVDNRYFLIRLDPWGNIWWKRRLAVFNSNNSMKSNDLTIFLRYPGGCGVLADRTIYAGVSSFLYFFDDKGNKLKRIRYPDLQINWISPGHNNGFIMAITDTVISGPAKYFKTGLARLSKGGKIVWKKDYNNVASTLEGYWYVEKTSDKGYIASCFRINTYRCSLKVNAHGNPIWTGRNTSHIQNDDGNFQNSDKHGLCSFIDDNMLTYDASFRETASGQYVLSHYYCFDYDPGQFVSAIYKYTVTGRLLNGWNCQFIPMFIEQTYDGGFIISSQNMLVKTDWNITTTLCYSYYSY